MTDEKLLHTPGPWKIWHGGLPGDSLFSIGSTIQPEFGVVCEAWKPDTDGMRETICANARLIAAAPEMFDMLNRAYPFPEINPANYNHDDAVALNQWACELVESASKLLEKIKGY